MRRVSLDARAGASGEAEARASAVAEASHFNARVAAWEPVVEPWEVAARYEATGLGSLGSPATSLGSPGEASGSSGSFDAQPRGSTVRVEGASALRAVATRAFAEDAALAARAPEPRRRVGVAALYKGVSLCTKA